MSINNDRFPSLAPVAFGEEHMSVLIAVDTSGSVSGQAIQNINANLNNFKRIVCEDELAAKCVDVCVISFNSEVEVIQDWVPIRDMQPIQLNAWGKTALNRAIVTGVEKIRERSRIYAECGVTERKPYLILMTDGYDTEGGVDEAARLVTKRTQDGKMKLFFLGFGNYDRKAAAKLTAANGEWCFEVKSGDYNFNDFFDFAANSTKAASISAPGERIHVDSPVGTDESNVGVVSLDRWIND